MKYENISNLIQENTKNLIWKLNIGMQTLEPDFKPKFEYNSYMHQEFKH